MDLLFISGEFLDTPVDRDKAYLLRYFDTKIQKQFVKYFLLFRSERNFTDHTGLKALPLWLGKLRRRLQALEAAHAKAKADFDLETTAKIEQGKYKLKT